MLRFVLVLVEPEHPHNIGFVARAMRCNALTDLRVVTPRQALPMEAWHTAHASAHVLDSARLCTSLDEALQDCQFAVAFSRRVFDAVAPHVSLPSLTEKLPADGTVALVFGRESKGLNHEELNRCALQCEIPVAGLMSLNLAQAVAVCCYELCRAGLLQGETLAPRPELTASRTEAATIAQMDAFVDFVGNHLNGRYTDKPWTLPSVRAWLQRLAPSREEMGALFGMTRSLARSPARHEKGADK